MVSSIAGDLDHKSCFELLTDEALAAARYSAPRTAALFRRHVLWTRVVADRETHTPHGRARPAEVHAGEHRERARAEAEPRAMAARASCSAPPSTQASGSG